MGDLFIMYFKQGHFLSTRQTRWGTRLILCLLVLGMMCTISSAHTALAASTTTAAPVNGTSQTLDTAGGQPALGSAWQPIEATGAAAKAGSVVPGQVLLQLASGTTLTASGGSSPKTSSAALNSALESLHATELRPLGSGLVLAKIGTAEPTAAAARLATIPGVAQAEPDRYVTGMSTPAIPLPASMIAAAAKQAAATVRAQQ